MKSSFPDVLRIEASGACNFRCRHCPNGIKRSLRGLLTLSLFQEIMRQFSRCQYSPRVVVLYHGGEPLLNPNLAFFIAEMKKTWENLRIKIVTNASLLTHELGNKLAQSGLDEIEFSFDGCSPDENNSIRRNADFARDAENALFFMESNPGVAVAVSNVQICTNKQLECIIEETLSLSLPKYLQEYFSAYLDKIRITSHPAMAWPDYQGDAYAVWKGREGKGREGKGREGKGREGKGREGKCPHAMETFTILSDGSIVPCCYDITGKVIFGNVLDNDVFDIWNSEKYISFRNATSMSVPPEICQQCYLISKKYLMVKTPADT